MSHLAGILDFSLPEFLQACSRLGPDLAVDGSRDQLLPALVGLSYHPLRELTVLPDTNQSINQPIDQIFNQSVNQSINKSIYQSINQLINQSINLSMNQ